MMYHLISSMMKKCDIPIEIRINKLGCVQYRFMTEWLPLWDIHKYTLRGWHYIWVFSAEPLENRNADDQEHYVFLSDESLVDECITYGDLHHIIGQYNIQEERRFLDNAR